MFAFEPMNTGSIVTEVRSCLRFKAREKLQMYLLSHEKSSHDVMCCLFQMLNVWKSKCYGYIGPTSEDIFWSNNFATETNKNTE